MKLLILWLYALATSTCCSFKKKLQTFYNFPDLVSNFQTFSMPGKLLCKFQDFFKNSRLYEPCDYYNFREEDLYRNKPVLFCQCLQVVFNFFNFWFFNLQSTFKISYPELNKEREITSQLEQFLWIYFN